MTISPNTATQTAIPPSPAERRLRDAEKRRLAYTARHTPDPEHHRWLTQRVQRIERAEPVCCHVERQAELAAQLAGASPRVEWDDDGTPVSEARVYREMRKKHKAEHAYPNGLVADVDNAFLGRTSTEDAAKIVAYHRARHG